MTMNIDAATMTNLEAGRATPPHPFQRAFLARDTDAIAEMLAPDVVLNSPIISTQFRGRAEVADLFGAVLEALEEFRYTDTIEAEFTLVVAFNARAGRQGLQGVDLFRFDENGKISEITVLIRPLAGLTALAAALGPRLTRSSRARAVLVRLLSTPLATITRVADPIAARLVLGRRDR
jgi:hypothetical protein